METSVLTLRIPSSQKEQLEKDAKDKGLKLSQYAGGLLAMGLNSVPILERESLPNVEAVYLIVTSEGKLRYLGQCNDLKAAIADHPLLGDILIKDHGSRVVWFGLASDVEIEPGVSKMFKSPLPHANAFMSLREDVNSLKDQQAEMLGLLHNLLADKAFLPVESGSPVDPIETIEPSQGDSSTDTKPNYPVDTLETLEPSQDKDPEPIQGERLDDGPTPEPVNYGDSHSVPIDLTSGLNHAQMAEYCGNEVGSIRTGASNGLEINGMAYPKSAKLWFPVGLCDYTLENKLDKNGNVKLDKNNKPEQKKVWFLKNSPSELPLESMEPNPPMQSIIEEGATPIHADTEDKPSLKRLELMAKRASLGYEV